MLNNNNRMNVVVISNSAAHLKMPVAFKFPSYVKLYLI